MADFDEWKDNAQDKTEEGADMIKDKLHLDQNNKTDTTSE